jgi:protein TonB
MRRHFLILPIACALAACGPSAPQAPIIAPTDLFAVHTPPPVYPLQLACKNVQGTATLSISIGPGSNPAPPEKDGRPATVNPTNIQLLRSSGNATLDENAITAVKAWEFRPATVNGQAVTRNIQVPITYTPPVERPQECFQFD